MARRASKLSRNNWHERRNNPRNIRRRSSNATGETERGIGGSEEPGETPRRRGRRWQGNVQKRQRWKHFSRQMYGLTHTHERASARTHTHWQGSAHTLAHSYTQTSCSECGSLGLALPQACGNSPESSSAVRPLPHAKRERERERGTRRSLAYDDRASLINEEIKEIGRQSAFAVQ